MCTHIHITDFSHWSNLMAFNSLDYCLQIVDWQSQKHHGEVTGRNWRGSCRSTSTHHPYLLQFCCLPDRHWMSWGACAMQSLSLKRTFKSMETLTGFSHHERHLDLATIFKAHLLPSVTSGPWISPLMGSSGGQPWWLHVFQGRGARIRNVKQTKQKHRRNRQRHRIELGGQPSGYCIHPHLFSI